MSPLPILLLLCSGSDTARFDLPKVGGAGAYRIDKEVIAAGGTTTATAAGPFTLVGTVAQSTASPRNSAGPYTLTGGFWNSYAANPVLFANGFENP